MKPSKLLTLLGCAGLCLGRSLDGPEAKTSVVKRSNSSADPMLQLSSDPDFHFELLRTLSLAPYEGADAGEVLVAASKIAPGDFEGYSAAFHGLASRVDAAARAIDGRRHSISARNAFSKAASYYRAADFFLHGNWSDPRIEYLWTAQLAAFDAAMALMAVPGERVTLGAGPGDNFTIPAIFFASGRPRPQPTLVVCNGFDGSQEEILHGVGQAALQRGFNVITYEGLGQPAVRRRQGLGFIPQWEKVARPVVDYALSRPEVDSRAIVLVGYSFVGFLAPRAAAFDDRVAAVIAIDGLYDFGQSLLSDLGPSLAHLSKAGNATRFNAVVDKALASPSAPTALRWVVQQGMWSFHVASPFEWLSRAAAFGLADLARHITVPVFVADAENEQFFAGQAKVLADKLGPLATYHRFKSVDGAGEHCSIGASVLSNQVSLDWLEDVLSREGVPPRDGETGV